MGGQLSIISALHKKTQRDYIKRVNNSKIDCMKVARMYGKDYWDGDRKFGYGGYKYDGRWSVVAKELIKIYNLPATAKILDVGCGKGFLLYEFKKLLPKCTIAGFDISEYAVKNAKEEVKSDLHVHPAQDSYGYTDKEFDLVVSLTTLHNLKIYDLHSALKEIERVGKHKYIVVESYRDEKELFNLECWALTAQSFFSIEEWEWIFGHFGYSGDYEFIFFE